MLYAITLLRESINVMFTQLATGGKYSKDIKCKKNLAAIVPCEHAKIDRNTLAN